MNQNYSHKQHALPETTRRKQHQTSIARRAEAEPMLRDIAFVLKMTQRVREEMDVESGVENGEPVLV